jgi:hypothetical protein
VAHRVVQGASWARFSARELGLKPRSAAAKKGVAFEKAVFKRVRKLWPSAWLNPCVEFCDAAGAGWAFPDIVVLEQRLVVECKLSDVDGACAQLRELYLPLLSVIAPGPWRAVVAVKWWGSGAGEQETLADIAAARAGMNYWIVS